MNLKKDKVFIVLQNLKKFKFNNFFRKKNLKKEKD